MRLRITVLTMSSLLCAQASAQSVPERQIQLSPSERDYEQPDSDREVDGEPADAPSMDDFHDTLDPHGRWEQTPEHGMVWTPSGVDDDWQPYTDGEWVYTKSGWMFVSAYPWGWAPFHYGRWVFLRGRWCWIPGYEWAPAWVAWRHGGGYVAWAPLGPSGVAVSYYSTPSVWIAVKTAHFGARVHRRHLVRRNRIKHVFGRTGRVEVHARHGPTTVYVSSGTRRPVKRALLKHHKRKRRLKKAHRSHKRTLKKQHRKKHQRKKRRR